MTMIRAGTSCLLLAAVVSLATSPTSPAQTAAASAAATIQALPDSLLLAAHGMDSRSFAVVGGGKETDPAVLWRTTDGGRTFIVPTMPVIGARLYDVRFTNPALGFACGLDSALLRTRDGGATWARLPLPGKKAWLTAVHFVDADLGVVSGARDGPLLMWTADGGESWTRVEVPGPLPKDAYNLRDVLMLNRTTGLACGDGGILLRTEDGCRSWQRLDSGSTAWLRHLSFSDEKNGFVVAGDGQVLASTDGGITWEARGKVAGKANSIAFVTARRGYVVTMDGVLFASDDGGHTFSARWRQDDHLCDVATFDSGKVLCVGAKGACRWIE